MRGKSIGERAIRNLRLRQQNSAKVLRPSSGYHGAAPAPQGTEIYGPGPDSQLVGKLSVVRKRKQFKALSCLTEKTLPLLSFGYFGECLTVTMKEDERYPRGTAYHEAGHAVVAWSFGLPVGTISVSADDASGGAQIGSADHLDLVEQIAVAAAGYMAIEVFGHPTYDLADFSDHNRIRELLEDHGGAAEGEEAAALRLKGGDCARERILAHKTKVIELAERLVQDGRVEAAEFLRLMGD